MENTNHHAGSATGIDLAALTRYDHQGCCMAPDATGDYLLIADVRDALARATPQHPEQAYRAMRSAHAHCPSDLPHLDKMRWMAKHFLEEYGGATPQHPDLSPTYAWLERAARCSVSEVEHSARTMMAYYQGAEFPEASEQQASVSEAQTLNILESCARWLAGRAKTTWAEEFEHSDLMVHYADRLLEIRAALSGRATIPSEADEHVAFNRWFHASGFTKYMDSMWAAWQAALTHRATTATPGHIQTQTDAWGVQHKDGNWVRDHNGRIELLSENNARNICINDTYTARHLRVDISLAATPVIATTAADQQGVDSVAQYQQNVLELSEELRTSRAAIAQQSAAQAQAGDDAACWREVVKRIGYRETEDGPQWAIDLPKPTRWGNTDVNFIAAVRAAMAAPATSGGGNG